MYALLTTAFPAKINGEERTIDCSDLKQLQALEAGTNLTDAGRETAKRVGSLFHKPVFHKPDNFYISGLPRTAETAECHYQPSGVVYDDPSELEGHYILSDGSVIPFKKHPAMNEGFSGSNNLSDRVLLADLDRDLKNPNVSAHQPFPSSLIAEWFRGTCLSHGNRLRTLLRKLKDRLPPELAGEVNTDRPLRNCEVYTFELRDGTNEATEGSPEPFDFTWSKEVEEEQYDLEAEFHRREEKRELKTERQSPTSSISDAPVTHLPYGASSETHHLSEEKEITSIAIVPSAEDPSLLGSSPSSAAFPLETSPESGYGDTKEQNTKDTATSWSALITPVITPLSTVIPFSI
ncbi:hypothetical protein DB88DRAFT_546532 [Papiliotrema laurentii]|uniref:Uncharacterized protein n=1 Tax=Papiliotrema laurentii TaxID=5418 RepID=A0AAD9FPW0_PAPLA|nr:hypothetical protein DB88DRAFT_546532 [Papiliotrema laurentii]